MERNCLFYLVTITTTLFFFVIGGCVGKSPSSRFYRLTSITESQSDALPKNPTSDIAVGIGPVTIADYIDQAKIVTRNSDNEIEQAEFDQWSGSFKNNITEVLAENIGSLLGSEKISIFPWRSYVFIDYQVLIDVIRCDGRLGKDVVLVVRWSVLKSKEKQLVAMKRSRINQAVDSAGYAALVAAYSRVIGELSREITETIQDDARK
jgi:uncharacterized protein